MKRLLKWIGLLVALLALGIGALFAFAWWKSDRALARSYAIDDPPLLLPTDAASLDHGRHLFETRGCVDCHGAGGVGRVMFDSAPMRLVARNLTPAALAARGYRDADDIAAAIRHGVAPDGRPLLFMPAGDFQDLSDADTAALLAHMQTLPPSDNDPGEIVVRPLGRVLYALAGFPLVPAEGLDHTPRARQAPVVAASVEYGRYVAQLCTGCHRPDFSGGLVHGPPGSPPSSNLTPHATGLAGWSHADFVRAMREGVRPDGRALDRSMPWQMVGRMTDTELAAMWAFFASLEPHPKGG